MMRHVLMKGTDFSTTQVTESARWMVQFHSTSTQTKLVPPYFKERTDNSHHRYIIMDQLSLKYKTTRLSCKAEASNKIKSPASLNMSETC